MTPARKRTVRILIVCAAVVAAVLFIVRSGPEVPQSGVIHVESTPEGALVKVGPTFYGFTPTVIEGLRREGTVYVLVEKTGYRRGYQAVVVPEKGEEVTVNLELEPIVGHLTLTTHPDNAAVFLDASTFIGRTPLRNIAVPIGEYTLDIRLENYKAMEIELVVKEERLYRLEHTLTPLNGRIEVTSVPTNAAIFIDQQLKEDETPMLYELPPGTYTISVYVDEYIEGDQVVVLEPNGLVELQFTLKRGIVPPGMIQIPPGEFIFGDIGAPEERPQRKVFIPAYYIDKTEVTNRAFKKVFPAHTFQEGFEDFPVAGVSWKTAKSYAEAVGKRLPTEMEWEKAARGPNGLKYPWGDRFDSSKFNGQDEFEPQLTKVGKFPHGASFYGCLDMAGNVYEWTNDWYKPYEGNNDIKVEYGQVFRVLRGGSIISDNFDARSAARHFATMDESRSDYGFRCAADAEPSPTP